MATKAPIKRKKPTTEYELSLSKRLFGHLSHSESDDSESDQERASSTRESERPAVETVEAVWHDEDNEDEEVLLPRKRFQRNILRREADEPSNAVVSKKEYSSRIRHEFMRSRSGGKVPKWATKVEERREEDSDSDVEEALKEINATAMSYKMKDTSLNKGVCRARLLKDLTIGHSDKKPLNVVRFHRSKRLLFTGGEGQSITIYSVDSDAKEDHFVKQIKIPKFPFSTFDFVNGGQSVVASSSMKQFLVRCDIETSKVTQLNLPRSIPKQNPSNCTLSRDGKLLAIAGKQGQVYILAISSMEHISTFNATNPIVSLQFTPTSDRELWGMTESGRVYSWIVGGNSDSVHAFQDEGAVRGRRLAISRDASYIACGSNTGIVNVYSAGTARTETEPNPQCTLKNIVTSISAVSFNHDGQILAAGSDVQRNSVRAMHVQSEKVFADFPARFEKVPGVLSVDFSPHSKYIALSCVNGSTRVYDLEHFEKY